MTIVNVKLGENEQKGQYKVGQYFLVKEFVMMLVQCKASNIVAVPVASTKDNTNSFGIIGNRWRDPIEVKDVTDISSYEINKIFCDEHFTPIKEIDIIVKGL